MLSLKSLGSEIYWFFHGLKPPFLSRKPYFNFLTYHYFYIIGIIFLTSGLLNASGTRLRYIDALFLASGATTQSGLNTVDINTLSPWQQAVLYAIPMITNPISINTALIFIRIYWFKRRFEDVVKEANKVRHGLGRTFSRTRTKGRDVADEERGIDGRNIVVMHGNTRPNTAGTEGRSDGVELFPLHKEDSIIPEDPSSSSSSASARTGTALSSASDNSDVNHDNAETQPRPQITFADQVKPGNGLLAPGMMPIRANTDQHIAIVERQRNRELDAVLRIPSPRDADNGVSPRAVDETEEVSRVNSRRASIYSRISTSDLPVAPRRAITIAEPPRPSETQRVGEDEGQAPGTGALRIRRPEWTRHTSKDAPGVEVNGSELRPIRSRIPTLRSMTSYFKPSAPVPTMPYLSWNPTIGRNSNFDDLNEEQMNELGGIEYRALNTLKMINIFYFLGFSLIGIIGLTPWIFHSKRYTKVVHDAGATRGWWAVYTASTAFNDVGFTLTPDSMISFATARWPLLLMSFLIILGNTGFPIMLRLIIWIISKVVSHDSGLGQEVRFLLDHPRRCFTLLFPSKATWVLFAVLVGLNGLDLFFYVVLDLHNHNFATIPTDIRVLDGWFQAVSTRTAGLAVIDLTLLHPAVQVSYLIMMYISILPIAISVRRTNVYEEKAFGVYENPNHEDRKEEADPSYIGDHLRNQLSFDLPYITLGFFFICLVEGSKITPSDTRFSMFAILFEVISAYGTVGLSLGYTDVNCSFSYALRPLSKLIIIAMQVRGRHRGLPYDLDRAVLLPSERQQREEVEAAADRMQRRLSVASSEYVGGTSLYRGRSRTPKEHRNIIASLFHPGPAAPMRRRTYRDDMPRPMSTTRRTSFGASSMATGRDADGPTPSFLPSFFSRTNNDTVETGSKHKSEGRRSFYKEGVNPTPNEGASSEFLPPKPKDEGKSA